MLDKRREPGQHCRYALQCREDMTALHLLFSILRPAGHGLVSKGATLARRIALLGTVGGRMPLAMHERH